MVRGSSVLEPLGEPSTGVSVRAHHPPGFLLCTSAAVVLALSPGCASFADATDGAAREAVAPPPDGYEVYAELDDGGRVACRGFRDCGAVDTAGVWRRGPGCRGLVSDRPPMLKCEGQRYYVLPDGSTRRLPETYYPPKYPSGDSNRLMVQEKTIAVMASDAEYEFGYVLLDERLEVVAEYGRRVRRSQALKDGAYGVSLEDGRTGRVLPDGTLVVDE